MSSIKTSSIFIFISAAFASPSAAASGHFNALDLTVLLLLNLILGVALIFAALIMFTSIFTGKKNHSLEPVKLKVKSSPRLRR